MQFIHRAYLTLVKDFEFYYPSEVKISDIVKVRKGDSSAINKVFVGILRLNGIPSRVLFGRNALSKVKGQTLSWIGGDSGIEYEQLHTKSQFYLENVGWVPIDPSVSVKGKNSDFDEKRIETLMEGFTKTPDSFITFTIDKTLIDIPVYGPRSDLNPQDFTMLFHYKKLFSDWIVSEQTH